MAIRYWRRSAIAASIAASVLVAGTGTAQASSAPHWRIAKVFGASYGYPSLSGGTAVSARQAWVVGNTYMSSNSLFLARWNGASWSQVTAPAQFTNLPSTAGLLDGVVAASAATMWTFPTISTSQNQTYALRLSNGHWTTYLLPHAIQISAAVIFSPSDVWAFGDEAPPKPVLGSGPPYAARFDGHSWHRVSMPGVPFAVTALSSNNIWAFGPTAATAGDFTQVFIAMRWTGRSWSKLTVPRLRATNRKRMFPGDLAALRGNSLWATEEFHCASPGCFRPQPPGIILAHRTGTTWIRVLDKTGYEDPEVEPDGHGGLWLTVLDMKLMSFVYLHYKDGRLVQMAVPRSTLGSSGNVGLPIPIPGTGSAWGTGAIDLGKGLTTGAVFQLTG